MTNKTARTSTASDIRLRVDAALAKVNARQNLLISGRELWDSDPELQAVLEDDYLAGYLQAHIDSGDYRTCPVPAHRQEWLFVGAGRYVCPVCLRLQKGMMNR